MVLGLKSEMTKPEAKRRLLEMLSTEGINAPTYLERALGSAKTFNEVADQMGTDAVAEAGAELPIYESETGGETSSSVLWDDGDR